jgi:hypothetical protein
MDAELAAKIEAAKLELLRLERDQARATLDSHEAHRVLESLLRQAGGNVNEGSFDGRSLLNG